VTFCDWQDSVALLIDTIKARGWAAKTIGQELDSHFLLVRRFQQIREGLPDARLVDFSGVLWEQRLRKSPKEIEYHRRAAEIAVNAFDDAIATARDGISERDVAAAVYSRAIRDGADNTRLALMASGARTTSLHGGLGEHILAEGDLIHLELVPHYRGYTSRIMRPISIGAPAPEARETAARLIDIQDRQYAAMKAGALAKDVDRICRDGLQASGLRGRLPNTTGYTLGYVAIPRTSDFTRCFLPNSDWVLEDGMMFHMYLAARGMAFSDTILVTANGSERLTTMDRRLCVARGSAAHSP
jgi:Xaa-Pro dipeptidase